MPDSGLQVTKSGSSGRVPVQTAELIRATGEVKENAHRVLIAGVLLGLLAIAYIVALFRDNNAAQGILAVISSGIGFLLGRGDRVKK